MTDGSLFNLDTIEETPCVSTPETERLCLKAHNRLRSGPCALCLSPCHPTGLDLFQDFTDTLVCDECGWRHAPELMKARIAARLVRAFDWGYLARTFTRR